MVYPALLPLMRTPRLPVVDWTDALVDLNGLVRFAERRNLVSARVPSHFNRPLPVWPVVSTTTLTNTNGNRPTTRAFSGLMMQQNNYCLQSINRTMKNHYIINLGETLFAQTTVINTVSTISESKTSDNTVALFILSLRIYTPKGIRLRSLKYLVSV